jgi:NAD(P)-dependent dehydrogenase (short-subunit alcohol dehydrogenase family)
MILTSIVFIAFYIKKGMPISRLPGFVENTGLPVPRGGYEEMRIVHPLQRNAQPEDIADAALFLASEQIRHITGVLLNVDGGRHMATN